MKTGTSGPEGGAKRVGSTEEAFMCDPVKHKAVWELDGTRPAEMQGAGGVGEG